MKTVKTLLFRGKNKETQQSLATLFGYLESKRDELHSYAIDDLLDYFDLLSQYWQKHPLLKNSIYSRNLIEFIQKKYLKPELRLAFRGNHLVIDTFFDLGTTHKMYHAQPRGIVVQWLAGNVPTLGMFSILSAILTKNVTLVKASSKGYGDLLSLLKTMKDVDTKAIKGKKLLDCIVVVLVGHNDRQNLEYMSKRADIRIAWGGHEAIQTITNLPKNTHTEDIVFGPKYSFMVIDSQTLETDLQTTAQRAAIDVSVFDQYACSSPHTIFIQESSKVTARDFAQLLAKKLDLVHRTLIPKTEIGSAVATDILKFRAEYITKGEVFQSKGTEWTVLYSDEKALFQGCFSRVIAVRPIKNLKDIAQYSDRAKQSLGVGLSSKNKTKTLDTITLKGIDRCPDVGYMTFFESPWDGMFVFDRLVRWVYSSK